MFSWLKGIFRTSSVGTKYENDCMENANVPSFFFFESVVSLGPLLLHDSEQDTDTFNFEASFRALLDGTEASSFSAGPPGICFGPQEGR